jgi:hypothetical protein
MTVPDPDEQLILFPAFVSAAVAVTVTPEIDEAG